jgi:yeast amino acid transporter
MAKADAMVASGRGDASPDMEKQSITEASTHELKREMSGRHLQFIAIGGAVGTGLFIGSGKSLATAGPVGCLISYIAVGTILYSVMTSLGEMATYIPTAGSFTSYSARFVDPALGFAMGWLYWFSCESRHVPCLMVRVAFWAAVGVWLTCFKGLSRGPSN